LLKLGFGNVRMRIVQSMPSSRVIQVCLRCFAIVAVILLNGCVTSSPAPSTRKAVIADFSAESNQREAMTREQLQEEVMRFADRFATQLTQVAEQIRYSEGRSERRVDILMFQYAVNAAPLGVAVAPNAVTNLLDMMVLASLSRSAAERFWSKDLGHPDDLQSLLETTALLERDIWAISEKVLSKEQQQAMQELIDRWIEENPDVRNVLQMRFSAFSGQRAAALGEVQRTGGLMGEVSRSVDAIEEMREYGERLLFYMQRFPDLARLQSEWAAYEMLDQPEIQSLIDDVDRLTVVAERLADQLPEERTAAIDQFMNRLASEREILLDEILGEEGRLQVAVKEFSELAILIERISENIEHTTASLERTALAVNLDMGEQTDIGGYTELLRASSGAAADIRLLVEALEQGLASQAVGTRVPSAFIKVDEEMDALVNRVFVFALLLIAAFFLGLFLYRVAQQRYLR
jgi:hypothetical protein